MFEYKIEMNMSEEKLNELAQDGWEVVGFTALDRFGSSTAFVLKREIKKVAKSTKDE